MLDEENQQRITEALLSFGKTIPVEHLLPTVVPEAGALVSSNPYAFLIATCLDRGTRADIIWTIPYDIKTLLGHLDAKRIHAMSLQELDEVFERIPRKPRYRNDAPRTVKELTRIVVEECGGDGFAFWRGRSASEVQERLQSIHGVGPGIASMGVLLMEQAFDVHFSDRATMNIKPDVHTVRVFCRLGVSRAPDAESAIFAARRLSPSFPGAVDAPLWEIGRRWCSPSMPDCEHCVMGDVCPRRIV